MFKWLKNLFCGNDVINYEVIYNNIISQQMWCSSYEKYSTKITTKIIKSIRRNGKESYEIKQYYSPIEDPFFDGEYNSNRMLETTASEERNVAKMWLYDKHGILL